MSHVFISYSKKNKEYARKLADHLLSQGFDVWIDDRIDYGDTWERVIFKAIDDCLAFLVIMTPQSYESDWVLRECHHAGRRNKPPFPVLLDGEEFPRYGITQFVDVRGGKLPPDDFYERLEKAAPRKRDGGADMTDIPASAKTPGSGGITGDLEIKMTRPLNVQKETNLFPPDVSHILPPPFEWCEIPAGKVSIEYSETDHKTFDVPQFWMAKYPVTNAQYQVFVDAEDGYHNPEWWRYSDEAKRWRRENVQPKKTDFEGADLPRTNVTWFEAVAFCQWFSFKLEGIPRVPSAGELVTKSMIAKFFKITLPTERQWQRTAQGDDDRRYPWGNELDLFRYNGWSGWGSPGSLGSISQPVSVAAYLDGASPFGVLGMVGNVWEWCVTNWETDDTDLNGASPRVLRGCAYYAGRERVNVTFRTAESPNFRNQGNGFRIVCISTIFG